MQLCFNNPWKDHPANVFSDFVFRNVMVALGWREKNGILQRTWRTFQMLKGTGMLCYEGKLVTQVRKQNIFVCVCLSVSWEWHFALVWFGLCVCMCVLGREGMERDYRQYLTLNQLIKLTALVERAGMKTSLRAIGEKGKIFRFCHSPHLWRFYKWPSHSLLGWHLAQQMA